MRVRKIFKYSDFENFFFFKRAKNWCFYRVSSQLQQCAAGRFSLVTPELKSVGHRAATRMISKHQRSLHLFKITTCPVPGAAQAEEIKLIG